MDLPSSSSSSLRQSQQHPPPIHDDHPPPPLPQQSSQSHAFHCYPYPRPQTPQCYYAAAHHQVPRHQAPVPAGVSGYAPPQVADSSGGRMAQVGVEPNPLAAATAVALSQLAQFAGTATAFMQANFGPPPLHHAPTLVPPPQAAPSPYSSGGPGARRGSRSFRGHGRGYNSHRFPKADDHGTGHDWGRGGAQSFQQLGASSASKQEPYAENVKFADGAEPSVVLPKETAQAELPPKAAAVKNAPSSRQPPQSSCCELCRVECTSLQMLEEHKNGKKHQRNQKRTEESKSAVKPGIEKQNGEKPAAKVEGEEKSQQLNIAQEGGEKMPMENLQSGYVGDRNFMEPKEQVSTEATLGETPRVNCLECQRHGMKRKAQADEEGKCMKILEAPRPQVAPCKKKVVIPLICDLCQVRCNTQGVFDSHVSGKKHTARLKRLGPVGLQVLYAPYPIAQTNQGNQPAYSQQGSHSAAETCMPSQGHQAVPAASGSTLQHQQSPYQITGPSPSQHMPIAF